MVLVATSAENDQTMFIRLTTNKDAIKDVTFSIIGGDDRDKFAFISGNELHFEHADFEAREDHTYSVEVAARIRNISRGNTKSLYGYIDDFIQVMEEI
jgi:hypothetical protein